MYITDPYLNCTRTILFYPTTFMDSTKSAVLIICLSKRDILYYSNK